MMHESDDSCDWPSPRYNRDPTTTGGPHGRIVVHHQALGAGCSSEKRRLGCALTTRGML
ncbi:hypothetical protein MUK42_36081 [Musa troglodytarum]|uniref:Uncharacterized protein n=1 Tax=Musa troglodytarum TaxID=320322 RepID=A0A9E7EDK8_9LILI|nr:hypothetical protein MUK42_36081 [Musa troglodytarum]